MDYFPAHIFLRVEIVEETFEVEFLVYFVHGPCVLRSTECLEAAFKFIYKLVQIHFRAYDAHIELCDLPLFAEGASLRGQIVVLEYVTHVVTEDHL